MECILNMEDRVAGKRNRALHGHRIVPQRPGFEPHGVGVLEAAGGSSYTLLYRRK